MALYPQLLAATTITVTAQTPLYNAGSGTLPLRSTFVKNIMITNNGSGSVVLNLFVSPAANPDAITTKYRIGPKDITIPPGNQLILDSELTLSRQNFATLPTLNVHGDIISIQITTASPSVDVVINGIESDM